MELKFKEVSGPGEKSIQEVEEKLLEESQNTESTVEESTVEESTVEESTVEDKNFNEEDVLSFIRNRYNKDINSVEDLFAQRESNEDLPEDVSAFLKYKKETNRGIEDFMRLQVDYDSLDPDKVLRDYYRSTETDLDSEDISYLIENKFSYDEDLDEESEIKEKKIALKKELAKAKKYFNDLKETYKMPVESKGNLVDDEDLEDFKAYKEYKSSSKNIQDQNQKRSEYFLKETNNLFNEEFKGFEFKINDDFIVFDPGDIKSVKDTQSDINNFISKYLDEDGMIKDTKGYHKALNAALDPDKMAHFFYEKGKSDAIDGVSKQSKNIDMDVRSAPQQMSSKSGMTFKVVNPSDGGRLKIKKR